MKVLIIDDDQKNLDGLTRLVRASWKIDSIPLVIVGVMTLAEGLKEAHDANVTILDLGLPDSDVASTVRAISKFPPPVIVLTAHDDPDTAASCIIHGAAHVFAKGSVIGLMQLVFESLQKDITRRATERQQKANDGCP